MIDVTKESHTCPLEKVVYHGKCSVGTCPYNVQPEDIGQENLHNNCLLQVVQEDFSSKALAEASSSKNDRNHRSVIAIQIERTLTIASQFREAVDYGNKHSCPNCGYIRPCLSATLCKSRQDVVVDVLAEIDNSLSKTEFWHLLVHSPVDFVSVSLRTRAKSLLSKKDEGKAVNKGQPDRATAA